MFYTVDRIMRELPGLGKLLEQRKIRKRFAAEVALIDNRHINASSHPSILHFSVNKAATQYVKRILAKCAEENGMTHVSLHEYAYQTDFPYLNLLSAREMQEYSYLFKQTGYLYSVFGGFIEGIPDIGKYKSLLMIRDPRDVLTSDYFSVGYNSGAPGRFSDKYGSFRKLRAETRDQSIDSYVLSRAEEVRGSFDAYAKWLSGAPENVLLLTYEEMVKNFEAWLDRIQKFCDLQISVGLRDALLQDAKSVRPKKENIRKHIRKGQPGDYREKLSDETIEALDEILRDVLLFFGYGRSN